MRNYKLLILGVLAICCKQASAQNIELTFPHFAGQKWNLMFFQGVKQDAIMSGTIDSLGIAKLTIPKEHKGFKGMAQWLLTKGGGLSLILSGEDISVSCLEAQPSEENIIYKNSEENNYLTTRYKHQQAILGKVDAMRMATQMYQNEALFPTFDTELKKQEQAYADLQAETAKSPLYAARFSEIVNLTLGLPSSLSGDASVQIKDFIVNGLGVEALYTSGHWQRVLEQWVAWYGQEKISNLQYFVDDCKTLLTRTKSDKVYSALAEEMIIACEANSLQDQEIELAFFLMNQNRIKEPKGKIASLYKLLKLRKGDKAPTLTIGKLPKKKTILVFHDSDCGSCREQINELSAQYLDLKKQGYEVVSISADADKQVFDKYAESLPWMAKFCNTEGFAGDDFLNYGVMGTPTFYIINKKGLIEGRYARVVDIKLE